MLQDRGIVMHFAGREGEREIERAESETGEMEGKR